MLTDVDTLGSLMECKSSDPVILDARSADAFVAGRIPGSRRVDVSSQRPRIRSGQDRAEFDSGLLELFRAAGVDEDSMVVLYDDISGTAAARGVWMLNYLGHSDVSMLDGGFSEWQRCGKSTEYGPDSSLWTEGSIRGAISRFCMATADDIASDRHVVLDVRSPDEYRGVNKRDNPRGGHIPGAIRLGYEAFIGANGKFRTPAEIRSVLAKHHIDTSEPIIVHCQSGARSANTYVALRSAGAQRVRNYIGSWYDWSRREDLSVETCT